MSTPTRLITFQHAAVSSAFSATAVFGAKTFCSKDGVLGLKFGLGTFFCLMFIFFLLETFAPPPSNGRFDEGLSASITVIFLLCFVLGSAGYIINNLTGTIYGLGTVMCLLLLILLCKGGGDIWSTPGKLLHEWKDNIKKRLLQIAAEKKKAEEEKKAMEEERRRSLPGRSVDI